jgi:GAF domain-containing protein
MTTQPALSAADHLLITSELAMRATRPARVLEENQAMERLIGAMAGDAETVLNNLTDTALALCSAGSTGISLLEEAPDSGEPIFRWAALSGAYAAFVGGYTPKDWSPCGLCLQHREPILLSRPGRAFTYFNAVQPPIIEGLIVPISYAGEDLGTLWIVSHDEERKFDREDVRIMSNLANATAVVLHLKAPRDRNIL